MEVGRRGRAAVVVLGDIGRSPRMQYHALSLACQACLEVDIVAYGGSNPHSALSQHKSIHVHRMTQCPSIPQSLPKILRPLLLMLKSLVQFLMLLWYLWYKIPTPDVFIVQNPPISSYLSSSKWVSWLRHPAFIVDWHNFGCTLLALTVGRSSSFVTIYHWIEKHFGRMASGSLCVTKAMQHELDQNWGIKLAKSLGHPYGLRDCISYGMKRMSDCVHNSTLFTTQVGTDIILKQNRPAVVSNTSWTPDEDFGILLEAALMYDRLVAERLNEDDLSKDEIVWNEIHNGKQFLYPRLLFIITGKGPEKEKYELKIRKLKLKRVAFRTMWLSAEDYPFLLGLADLGVCLHTSSSGLDLPMKVPCQNLEVFDEA
ncbi:hypothetical protein ACH5RR_028278 [Cinchona calisaya]|uniref:Glycosyltransferase subfamily 4-like N-terminal domain-containing protein n=1 Tax=Cinchona calisaya TaxID=153742 RepID=A0ABD2YSR6_9GENT